MRYQITRKLEFDSAHRVPLHSSKCKNIHGHRYTAEIVCSSVKLSDEGFVVDFGMVKEIVGAWIDKNWDHTTVYCKQDRLMFSMAQLCEAEGHKKWFELPYAPTAENMARFLFTRCQELLGLVEGSPRVDRVILWETPNCKAEWPVNSE